MRVVNPCSETLQSPFAFNSLFEMRDHGGDGVDHLGFGADFQFSI